MVSSSVETIVLEADGTLTEPLSAFLTVAAYEAAPSPCDPNEANPPLPYFHAIIQSGGPGTTGVGSAETKSFTVNQFGVLSAQSSDVMMLSSGRSGSIYSSRGGVSGGGTIMMLWNNTVDPEATIPGLPGTATGVRIDALIVLSGYGELNATDTKTICYQFIDDNGDPMSRTNETLGVSATTRELVVDSELGYLILVTYATAAGPRSLQWSGNIQLETNGVPEGSPIGDYSATNPVRENGKELAMDMHRRASMMLLRYADKPITPEQ